MRRYKVRRSSLFVLWVAVALGWLGPMPCATGEAIPALPEKTEAVPAEPEKVIVGTPVEGEGVIIGVPVEQPKADPTGKVVEGIVVGTPVKPEIVPAVVEELPPLKGPKKSVAVMAFDDKSGFSEEWKFPLGEAVADRLAVALAETGRFVVVEREKIKKILRERELAESGKRIGVEISGRERPLPAQIGISGTVTDFRLEVLTAETAAGSEGGSTESSTAAVHVAMNIRIFDTSTEKVLFSEKIEKKGAFQGVDADSSEESPAMSGERFEETPLGKATVEAIDEAVYRIAMDLAEVPWRGSVVFGQGSKIYINCGKREGVVPGQKFVVYSKGEDLIDPETGELLGVQETRAGMISVVVLEEKYSIAKIEEGEGFKRGDVLHVP